MVVLVLVLFAVDERELAVQLRERGPLLRVELPASQHEAVDAVRADCWGRHPIAAGHLLARHLVGPARVWGAAQAEDFPQQNAVAPHVAHGRVCAVMQRLRRCPLDGDLSHDA